MRMHAGHVMHSGLHISRMGRAVGWGGRISVLWHSLLVLVLLVLAVVRWRALPPESHVLDKMKVVHQRAFCNSVILLFRGWCVGCRRAH